MFQIKAKLIYNKRIRDKYLHLAIEAPKIARQALAGQFVNIKLTETCEPLLRRPFSIHRVSGSSVEILYEVVGRGTEILLQKKPAEFLDIIGPLGNGFNYQSQVTSHKSQVLVAGGIGVAPLIFLAEKLAGPKTKNSKLKTLVLIGAKTKNQILCEKEFKRLGCDVKISTDDGSKGFKGKVTELLKKVLRNNAINATNAITLYACGPKPMLKEISYISKKYKIPAQVSLEEHMACGIGACLGCVVNTKEGYRRVCKDGPVFESNQVIWE